jgi:hypothetical protein
VQDGPVLVSPLASAIELLGFVAFSYGLRELADDLDAPLLVRALGLPVVEVVVVWALLRLRGLPLRAVGFSWRGWRSRDFATTLASVAAVLGIYLLVRPLVAALVGEDLDLSAFDRIRGDTTLLILGLVQAVVIAGFREELLYRGFLMTRIAGTVQSSRAPWAVALVAQALVFGIAHAYQGPTGMIVSGAAGLVFGILMLASGKRLLPAMIAHAGVDAIALVAIYSGIPLV